MIVGGIAQGKLDFARRELGVTSWSEGALGEANCIHGLQQLIRNTPEWRAALDAWCAAHPSGVLICDEVGCGVTPLDREDREWREQVGWACCHLAAEAEAVYRVCCGLGVQIK